MKDLIRDKDRTVVIVSHDRKAIADLCDKVLWLNDREMMQFDDAKEVLKAYDAYVT